MNPTPKKAPLVFIPGLGDDPYLWRHQTAHLSDVASSEVADITHKDNIPDLARHILKSAAPSFAICGFSLGGYVALEILRQAPERVQRLALIATNARADTQRRRAERLSIIDHALKPNGFDRVLRDQLVEVLFFENLKNEALKIDIVSMGMRVGAENFVRQHRACMERQSSLDLLQKISCPSLVLCGRQDLATPIEMSEQIGGGIAGSRFVIIEDAGHYVPIERPQAVTALLRQWLIYN